MSNIKAGVVVVTKFCNNEAKAFSSYIDYIDRENAVRTANTAKYNLYQDYMGNPEKTTGLFTATKDIQTKDDEAKLKEIFQRAQNRDSLMWQTVISFDNRWLEKNGLYSSENKVLDEERLKGITRSAVNKMLEKEGLQNAVWSAAIHYNTDNIHVHIATVEPEPMRERKSYVQYREREVNGKTIKEPILGAEGKPVIKKEYKGRFKQSSIESCKREMVNQIINERENNLKINSIIRESIVRQKKEHPLMKDATMARQFISLYENMPDCNRNMWNYNNPIMHSLKPQIDAISNQYLSQYHKNEIQELNEWLAIQEQKYTTAYGNSDRSYSKTKMEDLYTRLGNTILKEIRSFDKEYQAGTVTDAYIQQIKQTENMMEQGEDIGVTNDPLENAREDIGVTNDPLENGGEDIGVTNDPLENGGEDIGVINDPFEMMDTTDSYSEQNEKPYSFANEPGNEFTIKWSKEYKLAKKMLYGKKPQYEKARHILEQEDMAGNVLASYELGDIYRFGRGVQIDMETAEKYYQKSLQGFKKLNNIQDKNDKDNEFKRQYLPYRIGKMYYYGLGTEQDYEEALLMFKCSDNIFSKYMLGKMAYAGQGIKQDYDLAYRYFSDCAEENAYAAYQAGSMIDTGKVSGSVEKMEKYYQMAFRKFLALENKGPSDNLEYRIGCMYMDGKGVEVNEEMGEEFLQMSAEAGNLYAKNKLAMYYLRKERIDKIPDIISSLKEVAEKTENIWSMYALGNIYVSDKFNNRDVEQAIFWYQKAEQDGNEYISYKLGRIYMDETSEYYDIRLGMEHMEKAFEKGNMMAAYQLGKIYADEKQECFNLDKAIEYFRISAEKENALAAYQLGKIFMDERQNIKEAVYYLKKAAEKDSEYATYRLGKLYYDEKYEMKDDREAYYWFEQSAKEGNVRAYYQMAKMDYSRENFERAVAHFQQVNDMYAHYYLGKIFLNSDKKNPCYSPKKGIAYLEQSAKEGNSFAELALGITYLQGKEVRRDIKKGKDWLKQAKEHGNVYAGEILKNMRNTNYQEKIHFGVSLTTAVNKMKKGLKSEWEKAMLQREHDRMVEQSLE